MSYKMPPSTGATARRSSPPPSTTTDSLMAQEKAAVKKALAQEASFRTEKEGIVVSMGASPAVLLTPSADPAIQRKVGAYTNSRRALLNAAVELSSDPSLPSTRDDIPCPLDHSDEQEQYRVEGQEVPRKHNTKINWIIGGVAILAIIGAVVGTVIALTGSSKSSSNTTEGEASNSSPYTNLDCNWNHVSACSTGTMTIPTCAISAYNEIMETEISIDVWAEDSSCSPAHFGAVALAVAQTNYDEVRQPETFYTLATLYFAAEGPTWRFDTNWLQGASPCDDSWFGIECYFDGSIRVIDLPGNNLKGSLSSQIGMLSQLKTLSLGQSLLSGSIPSEIGMLSQLSHLSVFDSFVYGYFPTEIGNLRWLKMLDIGSTLLSGSIPTEIGALNRLTGLRLAFNSRLTGTLPTELGDLSNLEYLELDGMRDITGTIPNATEWGQLTNLLELSLSAPSFDPSPFPAYLTKVTTLEVLSISASHVTGTIPTSIGNLTNLRTLLLEFNEFAAGTMPTELGLLTELGVLMIQDGALEGQLPSELGHLSKLELMSLAMNKLTGTVPTELGNLVVLSNLVVQRNRMHGNIPTEMCALSELGVFGYDRCGSKQATDLCLQNTCDGKPSWGEAQT